MSVVKPLVMTKVTSMVTPIAGCHRRPTLAVWLLVLSCLAGCASQPLQTDDRVLSTLTPRTAGSAGSVDAPVERETVLWGGRILSSVNLADSTRLEILAYPLDRRQRPMPLREAEGRFFVDLAGYVETADYAEGRLLTVLGTFTGFVDGTVGEARYRWPHVVGEQSHLWRPGDAQQAPRFIFGIGVNLSN